VACCTADPREAVVGRSYPDLIREKFDDGRLPYNSMPTFWAVPADGEVCDACDKPITSEQWAMEGLASTLSDKTRPVQFHVR
jgi:hypothetical protein